MGNALGAEKVAAAKAGETLDAYRARRSAGQKWCFRCRAWHPITEFGKDRTRYDGLDARCSKARSSGHPKGWHGLPAVNPLTGRPGPVQQPARAGDKLQARYQVNREVNAGRLPRPRALPCADCGHVWTADSDRRHEYDHHLGYGAEHHLDVQAVCVPCHRAREMARATVSGQHDGLPA